MSFIDDILGRPYEKKAKENRDILKFNKVIVPFGAFSGAKVLRKLYREAVNCFLLGFPNASMLLMVSCLEKSLKKKYAEAEGKEPTMNLHDLLKWIEKQKDIKINTDIPHGFRLLRNYITHKQKLIEESDAAEGIKYISKLMNEIFKYENIPMTYSCGNCKKKSEYVVSKKHLILGGEFHLDCEFCREDDELIGSWRVYKVNELL